MQPPASKILGVRGQMRFDRDNAAVRDADIDRGPFRRSG